ncbi:MAG: hypothetical protein AAFV54_11010 [Pseudomonadota bacterium]
MIWCLELFGNSLYSLPIFFEKADPKTNTAAQRKYWQGSLRDLSRVPKIAWVRPPHLIKLNMPDLFAINMGFIVVGQRMRDLLQRFELGETQLLELEIQSFDRTRRIEGDYAVLNVHEHKSTLVPEASTGLKQSASGTRWFPYCADVDGIAARTSASGGVDLWLDPTLKYVVFLSDRLARAIVEEGITMPPNDAIPLRECRSIEC